MQNDYIPKPPLKHPNYKIESTMKNQLTGRFRPVIPSSNPSNDEVLKTASNSKARLIRRISIEKNGMENELRSKTLVLPDLQNDVKRSQGAYSSQNSVMNSGFRRRDPGYYENPRSSIPVSNSTLNSRTSIKSISHSTICCAAPKDIFTKSIHPELQNLLQEVVITSGKREIELQCNENYLIGLTNLGNTCYMNSILQCLFAIKPFVGLIRHLAQHSGEVKKKSVIKAYCNFFEEYFSRKTGCKSPIQVKRALQQRVVQFCGNGQHDSQEFLRALINELHNDLNIVTKVPRFTYTEAEFDALEDDQKAIISWNRYKKYEDSLIFEIFGGQLESAVTCSRCSEISTTYEVFWDLSIPVSGNQSTLYTSLDDCLDAYFREEALESFYKCANCKSNQKATKKISISKFPIVLVLRKKILIVDLKRFKVDFGGYESARKLSHPISFPFDGLKVHRFQSSVSDYSTPVYNLVAISNHFGSTHGGHYTSFTKNWARNDSSWADRNDSRVTSISQSEASDTKSAYILFYEKMND